MSSAALNQAPECRPLRDATTQAFENLVAAALERSVASIVIGGNVYDGRERGVRAQLAFRDGVDRLAREGIRAS